MATRRIIAACGLIALAGVVAGCQNQQVVQSLPAPSFNPPTVVLPAPPPPAPVVVQKPLPVKPAPVAPAPKPAPLAVGVPREWAPSASARPWRWIIIHHSATPSGGAATFDRMHRQKGWDELGYHFVVGNGTDTRNGQVEVGPRWTKQKWGAHAKTADNRYNDYGIGICLVGNFDVDRPTHEQMKSVSKLVAYLMKTYHIPPDRVLGHGDTKPTDCPGRNTNVAEVRRMASQALADAGENFVIEDDTRTAAAEGEELLREVAGG